MGEIGVFSFKITGNDCRETKPEKDTKIPEPKVIDSQAHSRFIDYMYSIRDTYKKDE